ncbi:hypothetical protein P171DRAFT_483771 [Karstenula rhodostoma CBS 690.94]|uniref:Uncharacterized protein n=1 Tax=Karstenula rhodostoma CBS 690.94 TaxID=1392251 RepID=A0A9P4PLV3_9PLEO|nr:hypothetical protein P171DRAFT_483771 [Karstenula rhodostoma CBS 690.94]
MPFSDMGTNSDSQRKVLDKVLENAPDEPSCALHFLMAFCFCLCLINLFLVWRMAQKARKVTKIKAEINRHQRVSGMVGNKKCSAPLSGSDETMGYSEYDIDPEKGDFRNSNSVKRKWSQASPFDEEGTVIRICTAPRLYWPGEFVDPTENVVPTNNFLSES